MASHHTYDFRHLPERVQRQLIRVANDPALHLREEGRGNIEFHVIKIGLLVLLLGMLAAMTMVGAGTPGSDLLWTNPQIMVVYLIFLILIGYQVFALVLRHRLARQFGFLPGQYLCASTLVDARSTQLTVIDLVQLDGITATEQYSNGSYQHTLFVFSFADAKQRAWKVHNRQRAQQFGNKFNALQAQGRAAMDSKDMATLVRLDPFFELRRKGWPGADTAAASDSRVHALLARPWLAAIAMAVVLTPLLWLVRNSLADMAMYAEAKRANTEQAYVAYVKVGKFHKADMAAALPRVALAEVRAKRSVTAMRKLLQRYPDAGLQADVAAEIHALYQRSLAAFRQKAATSDPALMETMEKLLLVLEQRANPNVGIRFIRPTVDALTAMDARITSGQARLGGRQIMLAASHFGSDSAAPREARITGGMQDAFRQIFPNDILQLHAASVVGSQLPMLDIAYQIEPSGDVFLSDDKERAFVGLVAHFQAALRVDESTDPWKFQLQVLPPDHFQVEYKIPTGSGTKHPPEGQVYAVMAERAFDALAVKMHAAFFRKDAAPLPPTRGAGAAAIAQR